MKNIQKIITFFVFAFMIFGGVNQVHAGWNENVQGSDCSPSTGIQNTAGTIGVTGCGGFTSSATAQVNDVINVRLYFRNTGTTTATGTVASISHVKNSPTSFTFTGSLTSSAGNISPKNAQLTIPPGTKLFFTGGKVYRKSGPGSLTLTETATISSISGLTSVSLGTVNSYLNCLTASGSGDAFCYQGVLIGAYKVVQDTTAPAMCNDGIDNDGDGKTDYPADPGCDSLTDNNEYNSSSSYQCNDGIDNDSDGLTDYPDDLGCSSATDNNEYNTPVSYLCSNGLDDDGDGLTDYPADPGCTSSTDNSEINSTASTCVIDSFTASPTSVSSGGYTTLSWNTTNCTTVTIDSVSKPVDGSDSFGPLFADKTYTLNASNGTSNDTETRTVIVVGGTTSSTCFINTFYAEDTTIDEGDDAELHWQTTGCDYVTIDGDNKSLDGSDDYELDEDHTFYMRAWKSGQSDVTRTVHVNVDEDDNSSNGDCEIDSFVANPSSVIAGGTTQLTWRTSDCDRVMIDGINYSVDDSGYFGPLYAGRTYEIEAWETGKRHEEDSVYVSVTNINPSVFACNDGIDNDLDGKTDYPGDTGCLSYADQDEYNVPAISGTTITTLTPTSLTSSSARLNGTVFNGGSNATQLSFEWGTDANNLFNKTNGQSTASNASVTFFDTLRNLSTNTTYYYRAVGQKTDGTVMRGDIRQFALSNTIINTVFTNTNVVTKTATVVEEDRGVIVGMGTNLVQLRYITTDMFSNTLNNNGGFGINQTINSNNGVQNVCVDDTVTFVVEYRNISNITLTNAILHIDIPKDVEFRSSSSGVFNKADNTITINVGTLIPGQNGQVSFEGIVQSSAANRDLLVVPATLSFENPNNGARETAIAYGLATTQNCIRTNSNLAGFAFGSGFFPDTLLGWLLLILILLALIYLIRRWFLMNQTQPRSKTTTTTTTQRHYEDMDIPTAPYSHH